MSATTRLFLALALFAPAGCERGHSQGDAGHEDEGPAHVIPAHRPKSFPDGVRRLRGYRAALDAAVAGGRTARLAETPGLSEAHDVANWLPEVAAESDMPEAPWNEVAKHSAEVAGAYEALAVLVKGGTRTATDAASWLKDAGRGIDGLGAVLEKADPEWFTDDNAGTKRADEK